MDSFSFFVPGEPITEGSTRAFASGQRVVVAHDRGPELDAWRIKVAHAAETAAQAAATRPAGPPGRSGRNSQYRRGSSNRPARPYSERNPHDH